VSRVHCEDCNGATRDPDCETCEGRGWVYIWPDGQVRVEEPYRCGAFVVSTREQCTLLSDHTGDHQFAADSSIRGSA
jgi:DnaJ-class molecular chaperone